MRSFYVNNIYLIFYIINCLFKIHSSYFSMSKIANNLSICIFNVYNINCLFKILSSCPYMVVFLAKNPSTFTKKKKKTQSKGAHHLTFVLYIIESEGTYKSLKSKSVMDRFGFPLPCEEQSHMGFVWSN